MTTPANPTPAALAALDELTPDDWSRIDAVLLATTSNPDYWHHAVVIDRARRALPALLAAARQGEETDEDRDVLFEERTRLREVAFCFASAIRSGESWTPTLKAMLDRATAPWQEIARDLAARAASQPEEVSRG